MNRRLSNLPSGRGPLVVLALHDTDCTPCAEYAESLERAESLKDWDARVVVYQGDGARGGDGLGLGVPGVLVADEFGEVFFEQSTDHGFPSIDEIAEWARFIAIQCPECEGPEGAWREL